MNPLVLEPSKISQRNEVTLQFGQLDPITIGTVEVTQEDRSQDVMIKLAHLLEASAREIKRQASGR